MVKTLPASAEEVDLIPGPERSPGEGVGDPLSWVANSLSYFCLETPVDRQAWGPWGRKESDTT